MGRPKRRSTATARRRLGAFRVVSVCLLVLGAVGGGYLGVNLQKQDRLAAQEEALSVDAQLAAIDQSKLYAAEASRNPDVKAARSKAKDAAEQAAKQAKEAEDLARRTQAASRSQNRTSTGGGSSGSSSYGPIPASCNDYSGNRAIGCALMIKWGYSLDQMPCLDKMWTKESNWRTTAENKSSGAYGIPQALPASKLAKYGSDWRTNPVPQIKWGLDYIKGRYKSPCGAWSFWLANGWY